MKTARPSAKEKPGNGGVGAPKIILASEGKPAPQSYQGALRDLAVVAEPR